ncbi:hypothetical protein CMI37_09505 [Candidatus Pacearchaeota archaeon]|nr:hypothetical protein [Candidatus Pacearchaeota archaeon]
MATTFSQAIARSDVTIRFYLKFEGIPYIFLDGTTPVGPTGAAWAAPTSKTYAWTLQENSLDVSNGVKDIGPEISRRVSRVRPAQMEFVLEENRAGDMLGIMARAKASGKTAELLADFGYDTGGGPTAMTVDSTATWASTGYLYFGRETIRYGGTTATQFNTLTRNVFDLEDGGGNTFGDGRHIHNPDDGIGAGFSTVADYPRVWVGRWASLRAFVCDVDGNAYDTAFDGTASREVWRGVVRTSPMPMNDYQRWAIRCESIEGITKTDIGVTDIKGNLIRVPGNVKYNAQGKVDVDANGKPIGNNSGTYFTFLLDDNTRFLHMKVVEYTLANYPDTSAATYDFTGDNAIAVATAGLNTVTGLVNAFSINVAAAFSTAGLSDLNFDLFNLNGKKGPDAGLALRFTCPQTVNKVWVIDLDFTQFGSVGNLLGFGENVHRVFHETSGQGYVMFVKPPGPLVSAYIHPNSTTIPFYFSPSEGYSPSTGSKPNNVPSTGFAKIGGKEIVEYTAINSVGELSAKGLHTLTVSKRGAMGTSRIEHRVVMTPEWTSETDEVTVEFGAGFDDVDPLTAILRLAVSTGEASHHSIYDTLHHGVSVALNPLHFDLDQIASVAAQLPASSQGLGFLLSKTHKLDRLIGKLLQPAGVYLAAAVTLAGEYRIQAFRSIPPLESEINTTVTSSQIRMEGGADYVDSVSKLVNQLVVKYRWDPLEEEPTDDSVTVNAWDSQREFNVKGRMTLELIGKQLPMDSAILAVKEMAYPIFARYALPYHIFSVRLDRSGWDLKPGDGVYITLANVPTFTGVRGFSNRKSVVLQCAHTYQTSGGAAGGTGTEALVLVEGSRRQSTYAPAASVASKSGSDITLDANGFSQPGHDTDAAHFDADDEIVVFNAGDFSSREVKTIVSKAGNVLTLNSAVTLTVGADTYIVPDDYVNAQVSQRPHAHICSNADPPVLTGPGDPTPFEYV